MLRVPRPCVFARAGSDAADTTFVPFAQTPLGMRSWFPPCLWCQRNQSLPPAERAEPQGLKPKSISGAYGTAEAVPFHKPHGKAVPLHKPHGKALDRKSTRLNSS